MIISAHQPAYIPWAGYLHRIAISEQFVLLDSVQFEKNSFTNRNRIKGPGGQIWLTVPVSLKGHLSGTISDVKISAGKNWASKHWKTIQQNYSKAPYFKEHDEFFFDVFQKEWEYVASLNEAILQYLLEQFNIETPIVRLSELNISGTKQELIIAICNNRNATSFLFGSQGRDYVNVNDFKDMGVTPLFHEYQCSPYLQQWSGFIPNLSVIDMLFNVPADELGGVLGVNGMPHNNYLIN